MTCVQGQRPREQSIHTEGITFLGVISNKNFVGRPVIVTKRTANKLSNVSYYHYDDNNKKMKYHRGSKKKTTSVTVYRRAKKAWFTTELFTHAMCDVVYPELVQHLKDVVKKDGRKRKLVILMDQASCHPLTVLRERFPDVITLGLPTRSTSVLQPADCGFLKFFKEIYNETLLDHLLAGVDGVPTEQSLPKLRSCLAEIKFPDVLGFINKSCKRIRRLKRTNQYFNAVLEYGEYAVFY